MAVRFSAREYVERHYMTDHVTSGRSRMLCGMMMSDCMRYPKWQEFEGLTEFFLCQFELNLLYQAVYCHSGEHYYHWREYSFPFADLQLCSHSHGMGRGHNPASILLFMERPFRSCGCRRLPFAWDDIEEFTRYFLGEYLSRFYEKLGDRTGHRRLLDRMSRDRDCQACVGARYNVEWRHVCSLLEGQGRELEE